MTAALQVYAGPAAKTRLAERGLRAEGYHVQHTAHGNEGLSLALSASRQSQQTSAPTPTVVVLDVMLPGKDGFEVCRGVRQQYRGVILMLTARDEAGARKAFVPQQKEVAGSEATPT